MFFTKRNRPKQGVEGASYACNAQRLCDGGDSRIVRATEADIELSGEIVTSKVIVNTVKYYYDTEGKMTKKVITPKGGSAQTIYYETGDDNTTVKFYAGGRYVTSHSGTDSFGRKVFDELQLGTDFVSRQFVYHAGKVTAEHKEKTKVKSSATTQLVSHIALSDGRTISYEYDDEERIIKVTDTIDGTVSYTYDALGQLETETKDGKTTKFEYDNYGNITAKANGIVDEDGEFVEESKISYVYGNDTWKDLLTSYNGQSITYDAQGNPTSYLGHTLTWEKGRQLKSFDNNTYTYNANGIRTSKTVNGVKHEYTLDGTKILRETWNGNTLIPLYDNEDSVCGILYNNVPYYFIKNLQGDVIAIVDMDAQTVARYSYDAWGVCTVTQDSAGIANVNPFRYRSYYYDEEIGLYYLNSRYYDASVGRFINGDEAIFCALCNEVLTTNEFAYCFNSPINNLDASGYYTASSLKNKSWLFKLASNFGINIGLINKTVKKQFFRINLWLVKLIFSVSVGLTKNYKAGVSFNFTKSNIGISANLGMGAGYSLAFAYALSWTNITRSMSLVYSATNDGVYVSLDVELQINHLATAAVAVAAIYWPAISPVLYKLLTKSKNAAIGAMSLLAPIIKLAYT